MVYCVMLDKVRSLLISGVEQAVINDTKEYVKFVDKKKRVLAMFPLNEIKGFYRIQQRSELIGEPRRNGR